MDDDTGFEKMEKTGVYEEGKSYKELMDAEELMLVKFTKQLRELNIGEMKTGCVSVIGTDGHLYECILEANRPLKDYRFPDWVVWFDGDIKKAWTAFSWHGGKAQRGVQYSQNDWEVFFNEVFPMCIGSLNRKWAAEAHNNYGPDMEEVVDMEEVIL